MFAIGQSVRVIGAFAYAFPSVYVIVDIITNPDGTTVYILDQDAGGFDAMYLGAA